MPIFCDADCPNKAICSLARRENKSEIEKLLNKIENAQKFEEFSDRIKYYGTLTQEECSYLRHNLYKPVVPEIIVKSNSEDILSK